MLVEGANAGFVLATPVGLVVAGAFAAASAVEYRLETSLRIVRHARALPRRVLAVIVVWAVISLAELPPLRDSVTPEEVEAPLGDRWPRSACRCTATPRSRTSASGGGAASRLAFAVAFAFALLAEALVVVIASLTTSWQLSWWEWHVLMAISFVAIAAAARRSGTRSASARSTSTRRSRASGR